MDNASATSCSPISFGVNYAGETSAVLTYVAPVDGYADLLAPFTKLHPPMVRDTQIEVRSHSNAEVLATITLPFTDPKGTLAASTLADPPDPDQGTDLPALVLHPYGKGKVIYAAGAVETWEHDDQRAISGRLLRLLNSRPFYFEAQAPKSVEIMLYDQPEHNRLILHMLNFQAELPNVPVDNVLVKIWMGDKKAHLVRVMPQGEALDFKSADGFVELKAPCFETYRMLAIDYET